MSNVIFCPQLVQNYSLYTGATVTGANVSFGSSTTVGVNFQATKAGYVTALRFYKSPLSSGAHIGTIWNAAQTNLGQVTFVGETASGWEQQLLNTPIPIVANTLYMASIFGDGNIYQASTAKPVTTGVLQAPSGNGWFIQTAVNSYPNTQATGANFWVDLVFQG